MKCNHSYTLLYNQEYESDKLIENDLVFQCQQCKTTKSVNAYKFLKRESRFDRTYLINWVKHANG